MGFRCVGFQVVETGRRGEYAKETDCVSCRRSKAIPQWKFVPGLASFYRSAANERQRCRRLADKRGGYWVADRADIRRSFIGVDGSILTSMIFEGRSASVMWIGALGSWMFGR